MKHRSFNFINFKEPTAEEFEEMSKNRYLEEKENINNFSYWYPKIRNCGIDMVDFKIFQLDYYQFKNMNKDIGEFDESIWKNYCNELIKDLDNYKKYNIKNGIFSNKFDFKTCIATKEEIYKKLREINYVGMCFGTGGYTEFIVRELIPYDDRKTLTIYNGMPLRTEFRVFYDFDKHQVKHIHNYWDFDYCYKNIYNLTDKIIFKNMKSKINKTFNLKINEVKELVEKGFKDNNELKGIWSIDIMYVEEKNKFYLIDMAIGYKSAYWQYVSEVIE